MESTGVYWKPVYNLLEDEFSVMVVNAAHIKTVPGRKTDVKDAEWIAELLQHGLLRASFIPERPQRELRDDPLPPQLDPGAQPGGQPDSEAAGRGQHQAVLGGHRRAGSFGAGYAGRPGRRGADPETLAGLAKGPAGEDRRVARSPRGLVRSHQRFMLESQLSHLDYLEAQIERLDQEVARRLRPFEETVAAVDTIPGVGRRTAEVIAAEMGTDMTQFPSPGHLASWAGVCPE